METAFAFLRRLRGEHGQSSTEYAILLVWVILLVITAMTTLGNVLSHALSSTAGRI